MTLDRRGANIPGGENERKAVAKGSVIEAWSRRRAGDNGEVGIRDIKAAQSSGRDSIISVSTGRFKWSVLIND